MKGFQPSVFIYEKKKKKIIVKQRSGHEWLNSHKSENVWFYFFDHQFCQVATAQIFPSVWGHSLDGYNHLVVNHDVNVVSRSAKLLPEHPLESTAAFLLRSQL